MTQLVADTNPRVTIRQSGLLTSPLGLNRYLQDLELA